MVRFKLMTREEFYKLCNVTIPLWFDSNMELTITRNKFGERHNSTMVRFKHRRSNMDLALIFSVTIPLWFDSNIITSIGKICLLKVTIPLWFDSNSRTAHCRQTLSMVTIPLWFDSNSFPTEESRLQKYGHNSTMVRFKPGSANYQPVSRRPRATIPLWFDSNQYRPANIIFIATSVTIPLWFDSNMAAVLNLLKCCCVTIPLWFDSNHFRT